MANRAALLKKIQARKAEKAAAYKSKWAQMRHMAEEAPADVEKSLSNLAESCAAQAEAFEALRENLDLVQAPKEASVRTRVAAARNYAKTFQRVAEECPERLADAISEAYHSLDEQAGSLEQLAEQLGVDLNSTPTEEAFAEEGIQEMAEGEEASMTVPEEVSDEVKEGAGSDAWTTDRDESGEPKMPEKIDVPRVANSGPGGAGFVTDRDGEGKPEAPKKVEIPQAQGAAVAAAKRTAEAVKKGYIYRQGTKGKKAEDGAASAEAFVKDIPQSQGTTEVGAGKQGRTRPLTQIVTPAKPAASAEEFVKNIPQSQGKGETPGNKAAAAAKRR
jgi:hypothetical protein